jgi:hypothetical protein
VVHVCDTSTWEENHEFQASLGYVGRKKEGEGKGKERRGEEKKRKATVLCHLPSAAIQQAHDNSLDHY